MESIKIAKNVVLLKNKDLNENKILYKVGNTFYLMEMNSEFEVNPNELKEIIKDYKVDVTTFE